KASLTEAERTERESREALQRTGKPPRVQQQLDDNARALASAQRKVREAELSLNGHRHAGDLARAADHLGDHVQRAIRRLTVSVATSTASSSTPCSSSRGRSSACPSPIRSTCSTPAWPSTPSTSSTSPAASGSPTSRSSSARSHSSERSSTARAVRSRP